MPATAIAIPAAPNKVVQQASVTTTPAEYLLTLAAGSAPVQRVQAVSSGAWAWSHLEAGPFFPVAAGQAYDFMLDGNTTLWLEGQTATVAINFTRLPLRN